MITKIILIWCAYFADWFGGGVGVLLTLLAVLEE